MTLKKIASYTACGTAARDHPVLRVVSLVMGGLIGPNFELGLAKIVDVAA